MEVGPCVYSEYGGGGGDLNFFLGESTAKVIVPRKTEKYKLFIQTSAELCVINDSHKANSNSYSQILIFSINLSIRIVKKIRCVYIMDAMCK